MTETAYLSITPLQEPFEQDDRDDAGRCVWSCNYLVLKRPSANLLAEVLAILVAAGVGEPNVNLFASTLAVLPDPRTYPGPILRIKATGGSGPVGTHNAGRGAYRRPAFEVFVHAGTTPEAEAMIHAAHDALLDVTNRAVVA